MILADPTKHFMHIRIRRETEKYELRQSRIGDYDKEALLTILQKTTNRLKQVAGQSDKYQEKLDLVAEIEVLVLMIAEIERP